MSYFFISIISLVGSFIQRVSGFGFGIFSMIFLPYFFEHYSEANVSSSIISFFMSCFVIVRMFKYVDWKNIIIPALGSMAAVTVSVKFLANQKGDDLIMLCLGIVLLLLSVYFIFFAENFKIKAKWYNGLSAGLVSGVLNGLFAMGGPPAVIYFIASEKDKQAYISTIQAFFVLTNIYSIGIKYFSGFVTNDVLISCAFGIFGMCVGTFLGSKVFDKLNASIVKRITYIIMGVSGIINIVTSLTELVG